jgi:hypothetical protein
VILINPTAYAAGWNVGFRPDGREVVVVVVKGSFVLSRCDARRSELARPQQPLHEADVLGADPARDAPIHDNDFALFKPRCDVLLHARAHAPDGRPVKTLDVAFGVGECRKALSVIGPREWRRGALGWVASAPVPFTSLDIGYDRAFGGTEVDPDDPRRIEVYRHNPSGTGYARLRKQLAGLPLPATEEIGVPVSSPTGRYRPMAFGPLGRHWQPRCDFAGTYDERWERERMPFLPEDFDSRYHQAAPPDQQMPYPRGGEPIVLAHLSPHAARVEARLPSDELHVRFVRRHLPVHEVQARIDTVLIEPEEDRLSLTWRASCALERDAFELQEMQIEAASMRTPGLLRARAAGKKHYRGLGALVRYRREGR